jgi:hypothetical protein
MLLPRMEPWSFTFLQCTGNPSHNAEYFQVLIFSPHQIEIINCDYSCYSGRDGVIATSFPARGSYFTYRRSVRWSGTLPTSPGRKEPDISIVPRKPHLRVSPKLHTTTLGYAAALSQGCQGNLLIPLSRLPTSVHI